METELIKEINRVLKAFPQFWDNNILHRSMVIQAINQKEPKLIKALIYNEKIKSIYSTIIDGIVIFDFDKLISLLKYKEYWPDSFTKYCNSIGLTTDGKYLDRNTDVVLDFPFKDCVLEGGMTKEEQGKDEVYYHEVIARDEIDRLFSPKLFTNTKRYSANGVDKNITDFCDDDNLIIKGNNLIALHSLKERYAGKVKLIYIDPPYNTGNDGFKYNDRFNHSTWLVFMKNRLEVARELLSDDGSIWINIDDGEQAYLKVLMDQIFGSNSFISNIVWQKRTSPDARTPLGAGHDYILIYCIDSKAFKEAINLIPLTFEQKSKYKNPDNDPNGNWVSSDFTAQGYRPNQMYEIVTPSGKTFTPPKGRCWKNIESEMLKQRKEGKMWFGINGDAMPRRKTYLKDVRGMVPWSWWSNSEVGHNQEAKKEINNFFNEDVFSTPKPEKLIQRIIHIGSNEGDLVLDFHLGSGTTAAVAHKMGRRYIGIEQMDYIDDITVARLQKVIEGEQGGISKDVNWQGGGSFVYTELMELNQVFVKKIQQAQDTETLKSLFGQMKSEAHLNYQVALEKVLNTEYEIDGISHKVTFDDLPLDEQRRLLIELLDKNQLYVNVSEMDDEMLHISEKDKAFTRSFYRRG
ncbi:MULTISPECIES: site-specific DNA-methyltransferase [unclassified Commensalibacter]|uniref:DNA methyltransferase n=1 Tax=unclassified Commensalibacter TaxID=2630218 RepID=UPI0012D9B7FE|nr:MULTISPECIES: site-specific DNA-methyltransferase [unclassified Commensalibacter]MBI0050590.1 site-specific DNA-methyltransferase [Commensalibacter sp. B14384M3]MBI0180308.1 site-specific DNA-methyltransferase [Commensalibacter sp. W8163]MCT6858998.1 site-specific DNA-methyltransferase [Apilactobacillus sp.]MUG35336.1 site-specific DNA-methyltransferase [Commensalibacter sp. ESL0382]